MNLARIFHQLSALLAFLILYAHHGTGNSKSERALGERKVRLDREGIARTRTGVPRWPAAVALLSVGVSYIALSGYVTFGPRAWLPGLMAVLVVPLLVAHASGHYRLARGIGFVLLVVTTASVISVRGASASSVLVDAILIWVSTVLTFAVWYWEIDGGEPREGRMSTPAKTSCSPR
jgi:hypothetical protein